MKKHNHILPTYICDRKACGTKCSYPTCYQTTNRKHSITFQYKRTIDILTAALIASWLAFVGFELVTRFF